MTLAEKLQASLKDRIILCKVGQITNDPELPDLDREALVAALSLPEHSPRRLSNTQIAKLLKSEGYVVSLSTVDRHRRGDCVCSQ